MTLHHWAVIRCKGPAKATLSMLICLIVCIQACPLLESWLVLAVVFAFSRLRVPLHHGSINKSFASPFPRQLCTAFVMLSCSTAPLQKSCKGNIVDAKLLKSASLHRLFRVGATVDLIFTIYLHDNFFIPHFTLFIARCLSACSDISYLSSC